MSARMLSAAQRRPAGRPSRAGERACRRVRGCWRRRRARTRPGTPGPSRSAATSNRPPRPCGMPRARRSSRGLDPARPDHRPGQDLATVGEHDAIGVISSTLTPSSSVTPSCSSACLRILVRPLGERREDDGRGVDQMDARRLDGGRRDACGMSRLSTSASAPAVSTPVAPAPTITKFSAPRSMSFGLR